MADHGIDMSVQAEVEQLRLELAERRSEAQRRQLLEERSVAVLKLRSQVLQMTRAADLRRVVAGLRAVLRDLGVPFDAFGINVAETHDKGVRFYAHTWRDGDVRKRLWPVAESLVARFWREGPSI